MATDFDKNAINTAGGILPGTTNTPGDIRTRVETEADIVNIPNPFLGMIVYVIDTGKRFEITKLKDKKSGFTTIKDALVDEYVEYDPVKDMGYAKEDEVDAALDLKADKTDLEGLASEEFVEGKVEEVIGEAPEELNTLAEVAAELAKKVDAEDGKALMDIAEMERLAAVDNYDDAAVIERLDALEAIDHEEFLKEHQAIDHLAVKADVDEALELKADKADLEGLANEQFVNDRIAEVIGEAPEALDTLKEIADAMEAHEDVYEAYVETVKTALDAKADTAEVEKRFAALEAIDHEAFLTEHQDISHLAVKADVDAAMVEHEEETQSKFDEVEAEIAEVKVLIDEEKPYLADVAAYPTSKFLFACGQPMTVEPNTGFKYDANYAEDDVAFVYRWNDGFECIMVEKAVAEKVYIVGGFGNKNVGARRSIPQTNILVRDVKIKGVVGGCYFEGMVGHVDMELENCELVAVLGGGWCGASVNGKATRMNIADDVNIKATNCKISSTLFGGSQGNGVVDDVRMELNNCEIGWLTAGGSNGMTRDAVVIMNGGSVRVAQSTNRGVVHKARFILNDGVVNKLYFGGETEDTTVNGLIEDGFVELNGGTVKQFCFGTDNGVELLAEDIKGCIMDCVVEAGYVSMLEVIVPEVEPEIDLSEYAKVEFVEEQIAAIEHPQYDDTAIVGRVAALEAIEHHAQPNFIYNVEVVNAVEQAEFEVTGEFPDLVITLKLPQCFAYRDPSASKMWVGWIPYDETGVAGFNSQEDLNAYMTMETIQQGIDNGSVKEMAPQVLGRTSIGSISTEGFICVIVPEAFNYVAYIDNGMGAKISFGEIDSEDGSTGFMFCQNGTRLVNKIDDIAYCLYGAYVFSPGERFIYVEES